MGKKGRRGRSKKGQTRRAASAPAALDAPVTAPPSEPPQAQPPETETSAALSSSPPAPAAAPAVAADAPPPEAVEAPPEPAASSSPEEAFEPEREPDATPPPVGDLDTRFFAESPAEAWLAHELERRDPQLLRKMTANVARRRAHLARYVVGVVGVAVVLCLAALIKSAIPIDEDAPRALGGDGQMPTPAAQPVPLPHPNVTPEPPAASSHRADGGG
jgi:hypothetical protein